MAKVKVTYNGDSDHVEWLGVSMERGKAVDIEDSSFVEKAKGNKFFHVAGAKDQEERPKEDKPSARDRGAKAKADGKARSVPPAYRGTPEGEDWLRGYDVEAEPVLEKPDAED